MKTSTDETLYTNMMLDCPISAPRDPGTGLPLTEDEAFRTPGCHVKSVERDGPEARFPGMPCYFGRLVSYSPRVDHVVVISKPPMHGVDNKPTVYTGTFAEYAAMWRCD